MVWTYHPLGTLPIAGAILWCRFPMGGNPNIPGGEHHPVLVLGRKIDIENRRGGLIVAYGTGTTKDATRGTLDLIIPQAEYTAHGLIKPTRFDLASVNRLELPWCEEFFSAPRSQGKIDIGKLNADSMARLQATLKWRKENNRTD
jgi:hypothetical protein